tara:strand:- start:1088 stop:1618 length:531 start_codon:yes stop_codon:yes gene_type:complete
VIDERKSNDFFKDLLSALVLSIFSIIVMVLSLNLDVPGSIYTAPGLLPFIASLALLFLSILLAIQAIRSNGFFKLRKLDFELDITQENKRTFLLLALISIYVFTVGFTRFEFIVPIILFDYRLSSFQIISTIMITIIVKIFWDKKILRCFSIVFIFVESLSAIFRYGFGILMPGYF